MRNRPSKFEMLLTLSLMVTPLYGLGQRASAQAMPAQDNRPTQDRPVQDDDASRQRLAQFDQFLDTHPEIAEQVRKDPSLLDNRAFLDQHAALQTFLQDHAAIREDVRQNPSGFMRQENGFDRPGDVRDRDAMRRDFDAFMNGHREIAEQVRKDPSLLNNRDFVDHHADLQAFLDQRPALRDQVRQDPDEFMRQDRPADFDHNRPADPDRDIRDRDNRDHHDQVASFGKFLSDHSDIRQDVSKNPALVNNRDYVEKHSELQGYLNANPDVQKNLSADPDTFVKQAQGFGDNSGGKVNGWSPQAPAAAPIPKPTKQ